MAAGNNLAECVTGTTGRANQEPPQAAKQEERA
jgi:hypothetical protein